MSGSAKRRVRVVFMNCRRLDMMAASYLILEQNNFQDLIEFEVCPFFVFVVKTKPHCTDRLALVLDRMSDLRFAPRSWPTRRFRARVDRKAVAALMKPIPPDSCLDALRPAVEEHDQWLASLPNNYGGWGILPCPTIVVTETPLQGNFFGWGDRQLSVLSVAQWERYYAPPSSLEFLLYLVQRYTLRMAYSSSPIASHYPTRGCLWDFGANIVDIKSAVASGYLCEACCNALLQGIPSVEVEQIKAFLRNQWIGKLEEPGTVASNLKRVYGYDLARTKGLSPGFRDRISKALSAEAAKRIGALVYLLLGALGAWALGRILSLLRG